MRSGRGSATERLAVGILLSLVLLLAGTACGEAESGDEPSPGEATSPSARPSDAGAVGTYERNLIF